MNDNWSGTIIEMMDEIDSIFSNVYILLKG